MFESYRRGWRSAGPARESLRWIVWAYTPLVYTAGSPRTARLGAEKLLWYLKANKAPEYYRNPPGYLPVEMGVRIMRGAAPQLASA